MGGKVLVRPRTRSTSWSPRAWRPTCATCRRCSSRAPTPKGRSCSRRRRRARPRLHHAAKGRTAEGFFYVKAGLKQAIARGLAYAPYADLIWCETAKPDLAEASEFAEGIHARFPGKLLAYNCSPSFNWKRKLDDAPIAKFQRELGAMGYKFQFITLAGFHALNYSMFELARGYKAQQMTAYVDAAAGGVRRRGHGYTATKHQREVGAGYFDEVTQTVAGGTSSITALSGSTEEQQFEKVS